MCTCSQFRGLISSLPCYFGGRQQVGRLEIVSLEQSHRGKNQSVIERGMINGWRTAGTAAGGALGSEVKRVLLFQKQSPKQFHRLLIFFILKCRMWELTTDCCK